MHVDTQIVSGSKHVLQCACEQFRLWEK